MSTAEEEKGGSAKSAAGLGGLKRERAVRREEEPAFGDADVDHHEPRQRLRQQQQQQQQSRDDEVIVVSDSDTEDEQDDKQDRAPDAVRRPPLAPISASSTSLSVAPVTTSNFIPQPSVRAVQPQSQPSSTPAVPIPASTLHTPSAARATAVHAGNGHKRAAIDRTATPASNPPRASPTTASHDDDMPPLIPPPPPPPQPLAAVAPAAAALVQPSSLYQQFDTPGTRPIPPTQPLPQTAAIPPPPLNGHFTSSSNGWPPSSAVYSPAPIPVPPVDAAVPRVDSVSPLSFLQALLNETAAKPFASYCFACQCVLSSTPTSAAASSFRCSVCRAQYHSRCAFVCGRHTCSACKTPDTSSSNSSDGKASGLYHCMLCPRSFCLAHASTDTYSFSSLPAVDRLSIFSPTVLGMLVDAVLRHGDVTGWYGDLSANQIGMCRYCVSDMAEEEGWRRLQARRKMRIIAERT